MSWDNNSGGDDFIFLGGSSSGGSWPGLIGSLLVLAIIFGAIWFFHRHDKDDDRKLAKYIETHQCKLDYFLGGDKTKRAHYQCDNGQFLDFDLRKVALK